MLGILLRPRAFLGPAKTLLGASKPFAVEPSGVEQKAWV